MGPGKVLLAILLHFTDEDTEFGEESDLIKHIQLDLQTGCELALTRTRT